MLFLGSGYLLGLPTTSRVIFLGLIAGERLRIPTGLEE